MTSNLNRAPASRLGPAFALVFMLLPGTASCGGSSTQPTTAEPGRGAEAQPGTAVKPDSEKAIQHIREHVTYPTTRTELLKACANTPEFSVEEKAWFAEKLPEGNYASADDVIKTLGL